MIERGCGQPVVSIRTRATARQPTLVTTFRDCEGISIYTCPPPAADRDRDEPIPGVVPAGRSAALELL
jgi:hypothetical protein